MKRHQALLTFGAVILLPAIAEPPAVIAASVKPNDPVEWNRWWISKRICCVNPFFPLDGRETIYRPYEQCARTDTVGAYLDVLVSICRERYAGRLTNLP